VFTPKETAQDWDPVPPDVTTLCMLTAAAAGALEPFITLDRACAHFESAVDSVGEFRTLACEAHSVKPMRQSLG
jgi:hypothetical protein